MSIIILFWKNADEDYVLANMAKTTAKEWGVKIPSN